MPKHYLRADKAVLVFHQHSQEFAAKVNQSAAMRNNGVSPYPVASSALWTLSSDLLVFHQAIKCLCDGGWASSAVVMLRTMLDILINIYAIISDRDCAEYMGFKYLCAFLKKQIASPGIANGKKKAIRTQIDEYIRNLPIEDQPKAKAFTYQKKLGAYWYSPEFHRPADVLDQFNNSDIKSLYHVFSGGAHGGFLGLRILRDEPDSVHPNPRADRLTQNIALIGSARFVIEFSQARAAFEAPEKTGLYQKLMQELEPLRAKIKIK